MRYLLLFGFCITLCFQSFSQDFMIQAWYWDYPKTCNSNNWAQTLQGQVSTLQNGGFTYVWLPPLSRASFGSCSNGYDPKDLYDLGEFGGGATGFGTRTDVDNLITALNNVSINAVADIVLNHRDGGVAEDNQAVEDYITTHYSANKNPFPSDRFRCVLPLGGASGNNAGDYYFKISSKTGDSKFFNKEYKIYIETDVVGWQSLSDQNESEPNGGGDCGEANNSITLGRNWFANVDASGCLTDEFHLALGAAEFNAAGDNLYIYLTNSNGDYSDHRIYGIWSASAGADIVSQLDYQTYTDFTSMPSGQGSMDFENFRPNTGNAATTWLTGDWDWLWFFYDYDQSVTATQNTLNSWVEWLWDDVDIRGFRMDAVKHFDYAYTGDLLDYLHDQSVDPGMVVGEYFDTDAATLKNWIDNVQSNMDADTKSAINIRVFDFSLRSSLKEACDNGGYDVRNVFNSSMVDAASASGFNVVTFLNNHDYRDAGQPVQTNTILGYAYLLTNNQLGIPSVFYPEYFGTTVANYPTINLQAEIDALIAAHTSYIYQSTHRDYLSRFSTPFSNSYTSGSADKTLLFQLTGGVAGKDVIVCINFSSSALNVTHGVNLDVDGDSNNNFSSGQTFAEVLSNSSTPTLTVSGSNEVNIQLPAYSYSLWVEGSLLPVELINFQAKAKTNYVELQWASGQENELLHYEIEKSLDGIHFDKIGSVAANGSYSNYNFKDRELLFNQSIFYRLKSIDLDGGYEYSKIESVEIDRNNNKLHIYPNPSTSNFHIELSGQDQGEVEFEILNNAGQLVYKELHQVYEGDNTWEIEFRNFPKGLYFLKTKIENEGIWVEKLVKE